MKQIDITDNQIMAAILGGRRQFDSVRLVHANPNPALQLEFYEFMEYFTGVTPGDRPITFKGSQFHSVVARYAPLRNTEFVRCSFKDVIAPGILISGCEFEQCEFSAFDLTSAHIRQSYFLGCSFEDGDLANSVFHNTCFDIECTIRGVRGLEHALGSTICRLEEVRIDHEGYSGIIAAVERDEAAYFRIDAREKGGRYYIVSSKTVRQILEELDDGAS